MIKRVITIVNPAYLSLKNCQMVVRVTRPGEEEATATVPIEDIGVLVMEHLQITITQALMAALIENNVAIVTCDDQHMPVGLNLPLDGHNLQTERFREQLSASEPLRKQLWQQTVQQKIRNQAALLGNLGFECRNMLQWVQEVHSGDSTHMEGRAAVYYWKTIFPSIPNFVRGQNEAPPNNLLNYGYAIVRAMMARALVASGLLPTLGIFHHNRYNAYCLADDIMEPYRPYVDEDIVEMMGWNVSYEKLSYEHKTKLLSLPVKEVVIEGHRSPMQLAILRTAQSLQQCFAGDIRKIVYPTL